MNGDRVLVAGVGNIFLGDDAFGSEVARTLAHEPMPEGVRVNDYGIGGVHLAHDIAAGVETLILIDAVPGDGPAGEVTVSEVSPGDVEGSGALLDAHSMDPVAVLASVQSLGGTLPRTLVVGCSPETLDDVMGLSGPVRAALEPARRAVLDLVAREVDGGTSDSEDKQS